MSLAALAAFALAAPTVHASLFFTEDFSSLSAGPNMALGPGYTHPGSSSPTTDFSGGNFAITSGDGGRIYLGTNDVDYSTVSFTFGADVTMPDPSNDWSIAFLGMGTTTPSTYFGEPFPSQGDLGTGLYMNAQSKQSPVVTNAIGARDNGVAVPGVGGLPALQGATHRLIMQWNAVTGQATFGIDVGNDGGGALDYSLTVDGSDNGFNSTNSQLFLGGGNGLIFDNVSVSVIPEPSESLVFVLGMSGLLARRFRQRRGAASRA